MSSGKLKGHSQPLSCHVVSHLDHGLLDKSHFFGEAVETESPSIDHDPIRLHEHRWKVDQGHTSGELGDDSGRREAD